MSPDPHGAHHGGLRGRHGLLRWWVIPGVVTLALALFNSPWARVQMPAGLWRRRSPTFGLSFEMNFAVWWSAVLYLLGAALFYEIATGESRPRRRAYLQLSLLMLALVIDEIGSLHEWVSEIGGWPPLAPFAVLMAALLSDSLRRLWRDRSSRPEVWLVLAGFTCFVAVAGMEYAEHNLTTRSWSEWYGRFFEESTELLGGWLILVAAVFRRRGGRWGGPAVAVVPDPMRMSGISSILLLGFGAHLLAVGALHLPEWGIGYRWHGDPSAIYPFTTFFLLACFAFWVPRSRPDDVARSPEVLGFWSAVATFFLLCSLGFMRNLWDIFGHAVPGLGRRFFFEPVPLYLLLTLAVWFMAWTLRLHRGRRLLFLLALPLALPIHMHLDLPGAEFLAAGLFAFLCAAVLLRRPRTRAPIE